MHRQSPSIPSRPAWNWKPVFIAAALFFAQALLAVHAPAHLADHADDGHCDVCLIVGALGAAAFYVPPSLIGAEPADASFVVLETRLGAGSAAAFRQRAPPSTSSLA